LPKVNRRRKLGLCDCPERRAHIAYGKTIISYCDIKSIYIAGEKICGMKNESMARLSRNPHIAIPHSLLRISNGFDNIINAF